MNMGKFFLRWLNKEDEAERMLFRMQIAEASAGVEDLCRTIQADSENIKRVIDEHRQRSGHFGLDSGR